MRKRLLLALALLAATNVTAAEVDTLAIDAIYKQLLAQPGVTQTAVRYTGSWSQDMLRLEPRAGARLDRRQSPAADGCEANGV